MMRWVEHASTMASGDPPSARRCCRSRPAALTKPLSPRRSRKAVLAPQPYPFGLVPIASTAPRLSPASGLHASAAAGRRAAIRMARARCPALRAPPRLRACLLRPLVPS
ncbi:unnamed protein product, partial [Closterium sp. NIES-65]